MKFLIASAMVLCVAASLPAMAGPLTNGPAINGIAGNGYKLRGNVGYLRDPAPAGGIVVRSVMLPDGTLIVLGE